MERDKPNYIATAKPSKQLSWLIEAAREYEAVTGQSYTESSFLRGNLSISILDQIIPDIQHDPNILLVGLGRDMDPIVSSYEPFRIAAHLQGKGVNYAMTLVDVDPDVVHDVLNRRNLYVSYRQFDGRLYQSMENAWRKYLSDTQQEGRDVFELEDELFFAEYLDGRWDHSYKNHLERGVVSAEVSPQFRQKLQAGEIELVHKDIAVADIRARGPYDYAEFTNVMHLMSKQGQQLAMANIAMALRTGGRVLINDLGGYIGEPVLTRFNGWFDKRKMRQLGLGVEKVMSSDEYSQTLLLRKQ